MKIVDANKNAIEIRDKYWPLAENLFLKWEYQPNSKNDIVVPDIKKIISELNAWGIPWKGY